MREAVPIVDMEDEDFLSEVAAVEAQVISTKRRKITATSAATATAEEGAYTAALRGSRSLVFQHQIRSTVSNTVVNNPKFGDSGRIGGGGGGSCFKCGKSGHWARDCDAGSDGLVPEKACPCGLGSCILLTANTPKNRGRKFYKCPLREENGGCGFFEWCDKNIGTDNMTVKSQGYASNPSIPDLSCPCGVGSCLILTAKTEKNIGQKFYRCPANQGSSCGFFKWYHDHTVADSLPVPVNTPIVYSNTNEVSNKSLGKRSGSSCFRCGKDGHWAKDCSSSEMQTQLR
ncbi:uncharacterized protein LOC130769711 isoform X1 [Actinidia eriantha]|uniref:uncharacterized protein LOC130769711 isoform X1 n=1 Tax=Actinidia eriantha TaxID=165200 RepID=UPI00258871F5|nr:uncharacterized protein LOC130769711 isoform X1 [Actinidia eriantha]